MDVLELFPLINEIEDEILRTKTMHALEKAIQLGNWEEEDLKNIPFTLSIPQIMIDHIRPMISLITHINAVAKATLKIFDIYTDMSISTFLNRDAMLSGALLHDVGKFIEYEKNGSGLVSQSKNGQILLHQAQGLELVAEFDFPAIIKQAIAFHSTPESKINLLPEVEIINSVDSLCVVPIRKILEN